MILLVFTHNSKPLFYITNHIGILFRTFSRDSFICIQRNPRVSHLHMDLRQSSVFRYLFAFRNHRNIGIDRPIVFFIGFIVALPGLFFSFFWFTVLIEAVKIVLRCQSAPKFRIVAVFCIQFPRDTRQSPLGGFFSHRLTHGKSLRELDIGFFASKRENLIGDRFFQRYKFQRCFHLLFFQDRDLDHRKFVLIYLIIAAFQLCTEQVDARIFPIITGCLALFFIQNPAHPYFSPETFLFVNLFLGFLIRLDIFLRFIRFSIRRIGIFIQICISTRRTGICLTGIVFLIGFTVPRICIFILRVPIFRRISIFPRISLFT